MVKPLGPRVELARVLPPARPSNSRVETRVRVGRVEIRERVNAGSPGGCQPELRSLVGPPVIELVSRGGLRSAYFRALISLSPSHMLEVTENCSHLSRAILPKVKVCHAQTGHRALWIAGWYGGNQRPARGGSFHLSTRQNGRAGLLALHCQPTQDKNDHTASHR